MPTQSNNAVKLASAETGTGSQLLRRFLPLNLLVANAAGMMQVALPVYALSIHATTAEIGLIRGASGLGVLLLVVPVGFLVDRFGPKSLFITGCVVGGMLSLLILYVTTPGVLLLLMLAEGLFQSLRFTSLSAAFFMIMSFVVFKHRPQSSAAINGIDLHDSPD